MRKLWRDGANLTPWGEFNLAVRANMGSASAATTVNTLSEFVKRTDGKLQNVPLDKNAVLRSEDRFSACIRIRGRDAIISELNE